ncbi:MAG TPA: hypothetical protein VFP58_08600, partial [Candidatus Eisenbacteria bacterium]|nr:hypothetical protein [Candidatus Eisenbacteria bacterium]
MPDTPELLILPHRRAPAAAQMSLDAALLGWASAEGGAGRAVYRTYGWSRPTLSLGRAEPFPEGWDEEAIRRAGIDVVRRPTGGDAVLHDTELTFAVAAALPGRWGLRPRGFADLVAEALASALRDAGLDAERTGAPTETVAARPGAHPCFARTAAGEVRVGRYKVAGIASRFTRGAALSHASVPLTGAFRDVARFRTDGAGAGLAIQAGARAASELLATPIEERRIAVRLGEALAGALRAVPREVAFADL